MSFWRNQLLDLQNKDRIWPHANLRWVATALLALTTYFFLYLSKADRYISLHLKPYRKGLPGYFFSFVSTMGRGEVLLFLLVVLCLLPVALPKRKEVLWRSTMGLVTASLFSLALKILIGRPRPFLLPRHYWPHGPTLNDRFFSTPSGHTVAAFTLAWVLSCHYPRWRYPFMGTAFMIGVSRIFLLHHYTSDVVVSAFIGCLIGNWACKLKLPRFMEGHDEK